jgi:predicted metal-dependent HD superfamily phosphohydrolase
LTDSIKTQWEETSARYSSSTTEREYIFNDLIKHYSSDTRHYHNLHHIQNMLNSISEFNNRLADPDAVYFSVMFHDVVYESLKGDNEEKSAEYAKEALTKLNFPPDRIDKVCKMILATKNHTVVDPDEDFDVQILLDADLKILGGTPEDYSLYAEQVRKEYKLVPDLLYKPGRKKVLAKFIEIPFLFRTIEFRNRFEVNAKANLKDEWQKL